MSLDLFLSHADSHTPVLPGGLPPASAHEAPRFDGRTPSHLADRGGPEVVSWDFQQVLGSEAFVGRLAFTGDNGEIDGAGYEAYVDKVLRAERSSRAGPAPDARAVFYTAEDGSNAIAEGHRHLMKP